MGGSRVTVQGVRLLVGRLAIVAVVCVLIVLVCQLPVMRAQTLATGPAKPVGGAAFYWERVVTFPLRLVSHEPLRTSVLKAWASSALVLGAGFGGALAAGTVVGLFSAATVNNRARNFLLPLTFLLLAIPDFMQVLFFQRLVVAGYRTFDINILPILSFDSPRGWIMPSLSVALLPGAYLARAVTIAVDDIYRQDYIRTAHAKGLHPIRILFTHVLRNALPRLAAMMPAAAAFAVSALLVVEWLTNWNGLGYTVLIGYRRADLLMSVDRTTAAGIALVLSYVLLDLVVRGAAAALRGPSTRSEAEGMV